MDSAYLSLLGIILALAFLTYMACKGYTLLYVVPAASVIICVFSGVSVIDTLSGPYMTRFASFVTSYYLIFLLSAIFGRMIGDCGAAKSIAVRVAALAKKYPGKEKLLAVCALVLIQATLTYGGISLFVVVFTMVTIGKNLFEELDIPWSMYTCANLGSGTFTMTMLPGTPSIHNIIPMHYLGTTPSSAPVIGLTCSALAIFLGFGWILRETRRNEREGNGFLPSGEEISRVITTEEDSDKPLPLPLCLLPSLILLSVMNFLGQHPVTALFCAVVATYALFHKRLPDLKASLAGGAANASAAIINSSAITGFGGVVAAVSGYQMVLGALDKVPGPPIVQVWISLNVAACVTGSASAGLVIGMENLAQRFLEMGIKPAVLHRIASMSCAGLDTLPHNGVVANTLTVTRLGFKYGYKNNFIMGGLIPVVCSLFAVCMAMLGFE